MKKFSPTLSALVLTSSLVLLGAPAVSAQQGDGHCKQAGSAKSHEGCAGCKEGHGGAMKCGGQGQGQGQDAGRGGQHRGMAQGRGGMRGGHRELMTNIHGLIDNHGSITREIEKLDDGVVTVTRTSDPELVETLQTHVAQMYELLESGGSIRHWDALFAEIFEHADQIAMETELLDDGIRVRETSSDPYVVKLIQAHAEKVNEFVARGMEAMHEPTAVPEK